MDDHVAINDHRSYMPTFDDDIIECWEFSREDGKKILTLKELKIFL